MRNTTRSPVTLSRQDLYDRIWSVSALQLATEIGVSDVAIAKACKKHQIPKPTPGYWAKVAAGKAPDRPPLTVVVDPKLQTVKFTPAPSPRPRPERPPEPGEVEASHQLDPAFQSKEIAELHARMLLAPPSWEVPASLRSPHAAVATTLDGLRRAVKEKRYTRPSEADLVFPRSDNDRQAFIDVHVSREQFERSARLAQAILSALLEIGFALREGGDHYRTRYYLELFGARLQFGIRELTRREPHTPTADELADQARYSHRKPPKWDHFPAGILRVSIFQHESRHELRGWQDGKSRSVESMVREIVLGMLSEVDKHIIRWRLERERQVQAFEEAKIRQRQDELRRQEQRDIDELVEHVQNWEMAGRIRSFIHAAQLARTESGLSTEPGSPADRWILWASQVADRMDPLVQLKSTVNPIKTVQHS